MVSRLLGIAVLQQEKRHKLGDANGLAGVVGEKRKGVRRVVSEESTCLMAEIYHTACFPPKIHLKKKKNAPNV